MITDWAAPLVTLADLQRRFERGPKREGAFAVWLTTRTALDVALAEEPNERAERRRIALLRHRLAPLAVPRPLARGLTGVLAQLEEATPAAARIGLAQLVAPTRDALGPEAGEAVALAARLIHDHQRGASS